MVGWEGGAGGSEAGGARGFEAVEGAKEVFGWGQGFD